MTLEPHEGQFAGNTYLIESFGLFFKSTDITCGITSPALSILIVSPTLTSFLFISSSLCRDALDTITPPIFTGSICATGVSAPVLPTCMSIFKIFEIKLNYE